MDSRIGAISEAAILQTKIEAFRAGFFEIFDLFPKQITSLDILRDSICRELLYGGGAGGGKTWLGVEWLLWNCLSYPETRWFVGRRFLNEIRGSTIVTFNKVCKKHRIPKEMYHYNDQKVNIKFANGSEIIGYDLAYKPSDPDYDRFGSTEFTGGMIEEAAHVPVKAYQILKSRIGRHLNDRYNLTPKLFITTNPSRNWVYSIFYLPHKKGELPPNRVFVRSLWGDNTKLDSGYVQQLDELTGQLRARLYSGDWDYGDDPDALIESDAIQDIFTNDFVPINREQRRLICDIALHGSNRYVLGVFYGDVLVDVKSIDKSGGADVINEIKAMQNKHQIRAAAVLYDSDGAGGFVGQKGGFIPGALPFHGGGRPFVSNRDKFTVYADLKSQCGYYLAEKVNNGGTWAAAMKDEDMRESFAEELAWLKRDKGSEDGKLRLLKKSEIVEAIGRSPDLLDIFIMKQYYDLLLLSKGTVRRGGSRGVN